jgi:hypothetical protein
MRESDERSGSLFSYVDLEGRVRRDHPLRTSREIANAALADLTGEFAALYPPRLGRPAAGDRGGLPQLACPEVTAPLMASLDVALNRRGLWSTRLSICPSIPQS